MGNEWNEDAYCSALFCTGRGWAIPGPSVNRCSQRITDRIWRMERTPFFRKQCVTNVTNSTHVFTSLLKNTNSTYDCLKVCKSAEGSKHKWLKIPSFWDTTLCQWLSGSWCFETQLDGFMFMEHLTLEGEVTMFLVQVRNRLPSVTAPYPRVKESSAVSLWQPTG